MGGSSTPQYLKRLKSNNVYVRELVAELLGTFILILIGDAAFAQCVLAGKGVDDVFGVTWAWGVGVIFGVTASCGISGGHINPAVSVAFASVGKMPWKKVPFYLIGQHIGGFLASVILFLIYYDALNQFDPARTVTGKNATAFIWATYPRADISIWNCFVCEVVLGAVIMFSVMAIVDSRNLNIPKFLWPFFIGFIIQVAAQVFGFNNMAAINPARDFPTRIFTAIAGWGAETFSIRNYSYWWIGIVGPHVGYVIGAWLYYIGIELHWPDEKNEIKSQEEEEMIPAEQMKGNRTY